MSAPRSGLSSIPKRLPYQKPTAAKLTLDEATEVLESKAIADDEQAEKLRDAIKSELEKHGQHASKGQAES